MTTLGHIQNDEVLWKVDLELSSKIKHFNFSTSITKRSKMCFLLTLFLSEGRMVKSEELSADDVGLPGRFWNSVERHGSHKTDAGVKTNPRSN